MKRKYIDFRKRKKVPGLKLQHLIYLASKLARRYKKPATIYVKPGIYTESLNLHDNVELTGCL